MTFIKNNSAGIYGAVAALTKKGFVLGGQITDFTALSVLDLEFSKSFLWDELSQAVGASNPKHFAEEFNGSQTQMYIYKSGSKNPTSIRNEDHKFSILLEGEIKEVRILLSMFKKELKEYVCKVSLNLSSRKNGSGKFKAVSAYDGLMTIKGPGLWYLFFRLHNEDINNLSKEQRKEIISKAATELKGWKVSIYIRGNKMYF